MTASPAVVRMPNTGAGGSGVGVGGGVGVASTVNVQDTFWSARATAWPAASAESNTTSGHSSGPPSQRSKSRVIRRSRKPGLQAGSIGGIDAHPHGQERERGAIPEQAVARGEDLGDRHSGGLVPAVGEEDDRRTLRSGRYMGGCPLHRRDVVRVVADGPSQRRVDALAVGGRDTTQAAGEVGDRLFVLAQAEPGAVREVRGLGREADDRNGRITGRQRVRRLVDARGDAIERVGEIGADRLVLEDRAREVEDEDDVRGVVARAALGAALAAAAVPAIDAAGTRREHGREHGDPESPERVRRKHASDLLPGCARAGSAVS